MNEWSLIYENYAPQREGLRETLCALGNGYFVTRGAAPDAVADDVHYPGTYLAGGYNRLTSEVADRRIENEDLVNFPNWLPVVIRIDEGPWLRPDDLDYLDYRQELDLRNGILIRRLRFSDRAGHTIGWHERRLVSMASRHLAALQVTVTAENWEGRLTVCSALDGRVVNAGVARYRALAGHHLETLETGRAGDEIVFLRCRTRQSRLELVEAARTRVRLNGSPVEDGRRTDELPDMVAQEIVCELPRGGTAEIEKVAEVATSRDSGISEPGAEAVKQVERAGGFEALAQDQSRAWDRLWRACDISLSTTADYDTSMKLRLHVFHLLQTNSPHTRELDAGIPPRGWHGEAYRGHVMWDELFVFPFLNLHLPSLSRALLRYRWRRLPEARHLARRAGLAGAMFPWQSGSDGREESQEVHLNPLSGRWVPDNSHRQRHINAAIAYSVWHYYEVTDDPVFLRDYGAELLLDIARFWASVATYNADLDRYEIRGVMGPDEFHTAYPGADPDTEGGLNNSAYTNVMASWVLTRAVDVLGVLAETDRDALCAKLGITDEDVTRWEEISRRLHVPFHDDGIISQFDGYDELEEFDFAGYRRTYGSIERLDRILEAEDDSPNRYKVSKQADVLMLFYLFSADELAIMFDRLGYRFDGTTLRRTIDYYLERTVHGSSLSWLVHSWVLARTDRARSWSLFQQTLNADFADVQRGTTAEGIHLGAMAGAVDIVQRCYTGIEFRPDALVLNPCLPDDLDGMRMTIGYRQHTLDLEITRQTLVIASRPAVAYPVTIDYRGHVRKLTPGGRVTFRLIPQRA